MQSKQRVILLILIVLAVLGGLVALGLGAYSISLPDVCRLLLRKLGLYTNVAVDPVQSDVLFVIRLPRVLLGLLVGAALGISGAAVQGIFRNPLAEPGLLGISSGASLFAVVVIAFESLLFTGLAAWIGYYLLAFAAFCGAGFTAFVVYGISIKDGRPSVTTMLLAGIAINAFAGALTGLMTYMATEQQLRTITFWMLGSLGGATWENVTAIAPFIFLPLVTLPFFAKSLNAFALGEAQADMLGMRTDYIKRWVIVLSTLAVGASVAVSGIIGFVGLLVPHTVRLMGGVDHKYVLPASMILGATVLTLADVLSRVLVAPIELPIGVITALLGTPVFLYILIKEK
ncbi:iron ABC transporter permease [Sphingobacterium sp. SGG-5]|uniref:FecCD family ABC transporter permease n=1 Tax=Sphingobacterium sp. SGG-5 TaxID=2710881 RepID=UPI0013EB7AB7|nr:iron ABC transporter permease [Sphingobacterium sp. SGG-5]NGM62218.1 iron ABC transporter permease [Sphingobacterium sp. SGG-5]